jgi:hypothetical protein
MYTVSIDSILPVARKWKLAEMNGIRCLTMMNGIMERLSIWKSRELLGRYIFGLQEMK